MGGSYAAFSSRKFLIIYLFRYYQMITRPLQLLTSIQSTSATVSNLNMSDLISKTGASVKRWGSVMVSENTLILSDGTESVGTYAPVPYV